METSAIDAALTALGIMLDPTRLMVLSAGVLVGLAIGVIPGLGGIVGMALLIPFTFGMDAYSAFAFLIGMGSVLAEELSRDCPAVVGFMREGQAPWGVFEGMALAKNRMMWLVRPHSFLPGHHVPIPDSG